MKNKIIIGMILVVFIMLVAFIINKITLKNNKGIYQNKSNNIEATIISKNATTITIQDKNNVIYTLAMSDASLEVGNKVLIEYNGNLNKNSQVQEIEIVDCSVQEEAKNEDGISLEWLDNGIFSDYYIIANNKLKTMTLDEKIGQLFLVRYPDDQTAVNIQEKYQFGGYLFFEKDFFNKTEIEVKEMIKNVQNVSKIPMITGVDEEGGKVVRLSNNSNLVEEPFKSPSELYNLGGLELIKNDTTKKNTILSNLGLNLNLAPVVDVSVDPSDYMYDRTIQQNTKITSEYAKMVIQASKNSNVSYTLKHFPGYGNNDDTHISEVIDNRTYESIIENDLPPFESGIKAGAESILISHNIITNIDKDNPASLSPTIHNLLRNELDFTGIIITDDLGMGAIDNIKEATVKAILAGNDLIITTDYENSIKAVKNALQNGEISEDLINKLTFRVLSWKYYKGLMYENQK